MQEKAKGSEQKSSSAGAAAASAFDTPPEDIFASQTVSARSHGDDIFGTSSLGQRSLKKPEKSLDELLAGKSVEEVDGGASRKVGRGGKTVFASLTFWDGKGR